jgi:[acyl-carrier-protein] S-malonyltransferase
MENSVAFLYPGQGAQQVGMGFDLYQNYPVARQIFDQADRILDFSLSRLCFKGSQEELDPDLNAQLAVYTVSCILTAILKANNIFPDIVSGYSSGFYAAAFAAGCFEFSYGLNLVKQAGEILLEEGLKIDGGMAVIFGLSFEKVQDVCKQVGEVEVAILNTPRQIVISGINSSINAAMELALKEGALDAYPLSVATAYHSGFMKKSSERFLREIEADGIKNAQVPVVSYHSLNRVTNKKDLINVMAVQLSSPVLWVDLIKKMNHNSNRLFLEVGPGAIIFRTVKWIDRNIEIMNTATADRFDMVIKKLKKMDHL